jgi:hypothetical protein
MLVHRRQPLYVLEKFHLQQLFGSASQLRIRLEHPHQHFIQFKSEILCVYLWLKTLKRTRFVHVNLTL